MLGGHPNCRCITVPSMPSTESGKRLQNGTEWLEAQTDEVQKKVLGQAGATAWRDGKFMLTDIVGQKESEKWGRSYVRRNLAETLEAARSPRPLCVPPEGEKWAERYTRPYVSSTGGAVYAPAAWHEAPGSEELKIAKHLADNGIDVAFREIRSEANARNPDAFLNRHKGWKTWEFKRQTKRAINPSRNIAHALRTGKKRAGNVLVYIAKQPTSERDVLRGIKSACDADLAQELSGAAILEMGGKLEFYSMRKLREEYRHSL